MGRDGDASGSATDGRGETKARAVRDQGGDSATAASAMDHAMDVSEELEFRAARDLGGDGATAASAMDVSGEPDTRMVRDELDGVNESESPTEVPELACGCGHGYRCAGHRLTRSDRRNS